MSVQTSDLASDLKAAAEYFKVEVPEFVNPVSRDVLAGRMRLHVLDWGVEGRTPMLFVHGTALTAHTWDLALLCLRPQAHCISYDLRGHGDSEWSPAMEYGPGDHATDIAGLADALGLDRFVLVGMSLGGLASILYAGQNQDRLAGLVVVDIAPGATARPGTRRISSFVQQQHEMDSLEDFVQQALKFNPRRDPALLRKSLRHNLRELADGKWTWKYDRRHHGRAITRSMQGVPERLEAAVGSISCPALVVRGKESDVLSPEDAERFAASLPDGRWVEVERAGHTVQGDNPAGFAAAVRDFMREAGL